MSVRTAPLPAAEPEPTLSRSTVRLLTVAVGAVVANLFYAQPLEPVLADAFDVSDRSMGLAVTLIQVGYAVGLATLVPLGDLVERRRLIVPLLACNALALCILAVAPTFSLLVVGAGVLGVTAVAVQVIVPFAADLAPAERRGRVISTVMSGLLIGVLLSRTVAGVVSGLLGWRWVFGMAAIVTAALLVVLRLRLPRVAPKVTMRYPQLLGSVVQLVREEPVLRQRMLYGGLCFASFGAFWTSAGFMLSDEPYGWSSTAIGAFALVGVAGAASARFAGQLADDGRALGATAVFLLATAGSYGLIALGEFSLVALVLGVALMDMGCQGVHISNQSVIYALRPEARSRINTAYMTSYFVSGSIGSGLSALVYPAYGWSGVCALAFAFPALGVLVNTSQQRRTS